VIKWFIGNRPIVLLLLPIIIGCFVALNQISGYYTYSNSTNLGIWGDNFEFPYWFTLVLAPLLVLFNGITLSRLFNTNGLLDRNTYVSSLIYVVYFSFYHSFYQADGLLLSHVLMIMVLNQLFRLHQNEDGKKIVFNVGFLSGLAVTFHPALVVFLPFLYFSVVVVRPFLLRELLLLIVGFSVPLVYAVLFLWYFDSQITPQLIKTSTNYSQIQIDFLVTASLFILTVLLSLLALNKQSQKTSIRTKKLTRMLFWMSIASVILGLYDYISFGQIERFSLLLIPVSIFLTFGFTNKAYSYLTNGFFYLVLAYSILKLFL
jgi:hypothetical protein